MRQWKITDARNCAFPSVAWPRTCNKAQYKTSALRRRTCSLPEKSYKWSAQTTVVNTVIWKDCSSPLVVFFIAFYHHWKSPFVIQFALEIRNSNSKSHLNSTLISGLETCIQSCDSNRELANGKRYNTARTPTMSENNSSGRNSAMNSYDINENEGPEIFTLTHEQFNRKFKIFFAQFTRQYKDLTQLIQVLLVASHPNHYPRADINASYNAQGYSTNNGVSELWYFAD